MDSATKTSPKIQDREHVENVQTSFGKAAQKMLHALVNFAATLIPRLKVLHHPIPNSTLPVR